tara:strand:+ start:3199 stop:4149 length:951 start_codon:yes stop_codon:yes gene_type:complete
LYQHPTLIKLSQSIIKNKNRYEAHEQIKKEVTKLCSDREFIYEALRGFLSEPKSLHNADYLTIPLLNSGDIIIQINLFCPIRDRAENITHDNIHHHGWRLLTTGVISGDGYETINFKRKSHEVRSGLAVKLEIDEIYRHTKNDIRFIDSFTPHVVFHNDSLSATLAVWSADRIIPSQNIKRLLNRFPQLRRMSVNVLHRLNLNKFFGLNQLKGLYYHPENGEIVETHNYNKPFDGNREEILTCWFKFFEQINFTDADFWVHIKKSAPSEAKPLINKLIKGIAIDDVGIWGNQRRRFSKTQILQAISNSKSNRKLES